MSDLCSEGSGGIPCKDCLRLHKDCIYPAVQRRTRKSPGRRPRALHQHLPASSEQGTQDDNHDQLPVQDHSQQPGLPDLCNALAPTEVSSAIANNETSAPICPYGDGIDPSRYLTSCVANEQTSRVQPATVASNRPSGIPESSSFDNDTRLRNSDRNQTQFQNVMEKYGWEYHEPWSWTSVCSETGSDWISSVTGSQGFVAVAKQFTKDLVSQSPDDKNELPDTTPMEIDEATARDYVEGKSSTLCPKSFVMPTNEKLYSVL